MNCTSHPAGSYVSGSSVALAVPVNGALNVSWLYTPQPGILQGSRILWDGTPFTQAFLTLDGSLTIPSGASPFTSTVSSGTHTVTSNMPAGFIVAYSVCPNCTLHPPSSFVNGAAVTVQVPPNGFADVQFQYTSTTAPPLTIVGPSPNQTVSGNLTLSVAGPSASKVASVEYMIGSYRIARVAAQAVNPNFQYVWNSALASDGSSQVEVTARDYLDNIVYQDVRPIILNNFGNAATVVVPAQISGSNTLTLLGYDRLHYPAYWQIFLDGEILPTTTGLLFSDHDGVHSNSRTTVLDSTLYPNGRHEFHFAFHSNDYPASSASGAGLDFRGMVTQNVNIDNGRALMEILPNYLFVYTPVSTGVQLTCARAYTNGDRDGCPAPTYTIDTPTSSAGMQVSASGLVIGFQEGYGNITVSDSGKTAIVHVWVRNTPGLPHFQDAGSVGTTYLAGKSLFVTAPFQLAPELLSGNAQLLLDTKRAGINTLNRGMFLSNSNAALSFNSWKQSFDSAGYATSYAWSAANGFRVLASGDDIARRPGWEGSWISSWPSAPQAVQYAMQTLAQSGAGLSIDVVDESSLLWGSNPTPAGTIGSAHSFQSGSCAGILCTFLWPSLTDPLDWQFHDIVAPGKTFVLGGSSALTTPAGSADVITSVVNSTVKFTSPNASATGQSFSAANAPNLDFLWFSGATSCPGNTTCNPPVPNGTLSNVASWLRGASATVPISWPPAGTAAPYIQGNWMKAGGVSDYASHYWDSNQQRRTYVFGMGAAETQTSMLAAFLSRQALININRPQILEQSMAGMDYMKYSPAGTAAYAPPTDKLLHVGETPRGVVTGIMTAAAAGSAGVKLYKFDTGFLDRFNNRGNGAEVESDGGPTTGETLNWQAMGYAAATLTKSLQEFVLGQPSNSAYLGRNIITGARLGTNGNLLYVVNGWDGPRTITLDVTPHRTGNSVLRYRISDVSIKLSALGDVAGDTVALAAGETAVYLFPKSASVPGIETITFQPDTPGIRTVLRTNYLYGQNTAAFGDPVDCSAGCTAKIDRKVGEAFYSYTVLDSSGTEQCRSSALTIPAGTSIALAVGTQTRGSICQ